MLPASPIDEEIIQALREGTPSQAMVMIIETRLEIPILREDLITRISQLPADQAKLAISTLHRLGHARCIILQLLIKTKIEPPEAGLIAIFAENPEQRQELIKHILQLPAEQARVSIAALHWFGFALFEQIIQILLAGTPSEADLLLFDLFMKTPSQGQALIIEISLLPTDKARAGFRALHKMGHIHSMLYYPLTLSHFMRWILDKTFLTKLVTTTAYVIVRKILPVILAPLYLISNGLRPVIGAYVLEALGLISFIATCASFIAIFSLPILAVPAVLPLWALSVLLSYQFSIALQNEVVAVGIEKMQEDIDAHGTLHRIGNRRLSFMSRVYQYINAKTFVPLAKKISASRLRFVDTALATLRWALFYALPVPVLQPVVLPMLGVNFLATVLVWHLTVYKNTDIGNDRIGTEDARFVAHLNNEFDVTPDNLSKVKTLVADKSQQFDDLLSTTISQLTEANNTKNFAKAYKALHHFQGRTIAINPQLNENQIIANIHQCISGYGWLSLCEGKSFANQPELDNSQMQVVNNIIDTMQKMKAQIVDQIAPVQQGAKEDSNLIYAFKKVRRFEEINAPREKVLTTSTKKPHLQLGY